MGKNDGQKSTDWIEMTPEPEAVSTGSLWAQHSTAACPSRALYPQGPSSIPKISDCDWGWLLSL